jgi:hypothetical protein
MATSNTKTTKPADEVEISTPPATDRPAPQAPSFGLCAGTVADLEQVEKTVDPFTSKVVTREDLR